MAKVIAFDVNETLLNLKVLDEPFEQAFGNAALRAQWFALMLQLSFVGGLTGEYVDFTSAQRSAYVMLAQRQGVQATSSDAEQMVERMSSLPAHTEVPAALARLSDSPLRVCALVNSLASVGEAQLRHAGIRDHFEQVISADSVRKLKPAPEPYHAVAAGFDVDINEVRLVAAHSWDVSGALAAGAQAAFVARPGMVLSPLGRQPDIVEADIAAVVSRILAADA